MWLEPSELQSCSHVQIVGALPADRFILQTDSRKLAAGEVFLALRGELHDGHNFIDEVAQKGARGVIAQVPAPSNWAAHYPGVFYFQVEDTLRTLSLLAMRRSVRLQRLGCKVVGITGSNGKTTTKEFLSQMARFILGQGVHSNKGSFNNHWGLPFNILSAPLDTKLLICEMGMNHRGEISALSAIAQPNYVVCTMVGTAHIENFGSQESIAQAKYEIYQANPSAVGVFNLSNDWTSQMIRWDQRPQKMYFMVNGVNRLNELNPHVALSSEVLPDGFLKVWGHIGGLEQERALPIIGLHNVINVAAAATMLLALGYEPSKIWESMKELKASWGRGQLLKSQKGFSILFDGYNANPESMTAAIDVVKSLPIRGRVFAVLGDMKELGDHSSEAHRKLGYQVGSLPWAKVVFLGEARDTFKAGFLEAGGSTENIIISNTYDFSLAQQLLSVLDKNDLVFVKASRSMHLEQVVRDLGALNFEMNK